MANFSRKFVSASNQFLLRSGNAFAVAGTWSLAAWVYFTNNAASPTPMSFGLTTDISKSVSFYRDHSTARIRSLVDGHTGLTSDFSVSLNTWTHIILTRSSGNVLSLYVNQTDKKDTSPETFTAWTANRSAIGCLHRASSATSRHFDGYVLWPAVWDKELTSDEIAALYSGKNPADVNSDDLILFPNMNTLVDAVDNSEWVDSGGSTASDFLPPFAEESNNIFLRTQLSPYITRKAV